MKQQVKENVECQGLARLMQCLHAGPDPLRDQFAEDELMFNYS